MNVPIRMLGIATLFFWVILIAFIASAAYFIKDLSFGFGEPQFTVAPNHKLLFSLPLHIDNRGYYSLKAFNITTVFSDAEGSEISRASTFVSAIPQGQNVTIFHNAALSMDSLLEKGEQYLFNDNNLTASVTAGLNFAEFIPAQLSTNITYPWGAPFYNFMLGQPSYDLSSSTYSRVTVPLSFENHAAFDLAGNIRVELYDSGNSLLGESQTAFNAPRSSSYHGSLEFGVPLNTAFSSADRSGHFKVFFSTSLFEYGPLVVPYG
jgi:hypothetical protein